MALHCELYNPKGLFSAKSDQNQIMQPIDLKVEKSPL